MRAQSETFGHLQYLRADHFGLDGRGKSFPLTQRQAERLDIRPGLPFDSTHFDLGRHPIVRIGNKFHTPHQLLHSSIPRQRPEA